MKITILLCLVAAAFAARHHATHAPTTTVDPKTEAGRLHALETMFSRFQQQLETVTRQLLLQQLYVDERTRSEGDSG